MVEQMKASPLREKSMDFAVRVLAFARVLREEHKEFSLADQFLRSGTTNGMNVLQHAKSSTLGIAVMALVLLFSLAFPSFAAIPWFFDSAQITENTAINIPDAYTSLLPRLCPWEADEHLALPPALKDCQRRVYHFRFDDLQIDYVGHWETFDVFHTFDSNQLHRAVLLRDGNHLWHFLQISFWGELGEDSLPEIWDLEGRSILASPVNLSGNGGWKREEYWVLPPGADWPVLLDVSAVPPTAQRVVPAGCSTLWRSGHLDLRNLRYSAFVWRPDDGACCPSGGYIDMSLALDGLRVVVCDVHWLPSDDEFTRGHLSRPVHTSGRNVYVADGKTGVIPDAFDGCATIREAYETVLPVLYHWAFAPENPQRLSLDALEASTRMLEPWEGFRLAQVVDGEQSHQAILMELPGSGWHFAFLQFGNSSGFPVPEPWMVDGHPILACRFPLEGDDGPHADLYWIKDVATGEPRILDLSEIDGAEYRCCPRNSFTRPRGTKLDLRNLACSISLWHPSDDPCRPSGGSIDMSLAIDGTRIVVTDVR